MSDQNKIACSGCGGCCRKIKYDITVAKARLAYEDDPLHKLYRALADFPFGVRRDGSCEKLNKDGTCSVYETRPDICNSEWIYEHILSELYPDKNDYIKLSASSCNLIIREFNLDSKFLIPE